MKGPGYKLSHDVRRTWRCPACGATRKVAGDVTSMRCSCQESGPFMTIATERTVAPRPLQLISDHDVRSSVFGIDDMPVLVPHPSSLPQERTGPRRPRPGSDAGARSIPEEPTARDEPAQSLSEPITPQPAPEILQPPPEVPKPAPAPAEEPEDDWGAGIL